MIETFDTDVAIVGAGGAGLRAAIAAVNTAEANFATAKAAKITLTTAVTVADSNGKAFIGTARSVLEPFLGTQPSMAWEPVGVYLSI